jgi:alkylated DNA nucleotide flippase Atl1
MTALAVERLRDVVASIPPGRWATYGDVARACGGSDRHARTLNRRFQRERLPGAHRVLKRNGTVAPTALRESGRGAPTPRGGRGDFQGRSRGPLSARRPC